MNFRGRRIDPLGLWSSYVDFPPNMDLNSEFTSKVQCPNPSHDTLKRHFQVNLEQPLVHCFANCGISGTYQRAISMIEGIDERKARRIILAHCTGHATSTGTGTGARARAEDRAVAIVPDLSVFSFLPAAAIEYLGSRGITESTIAAFRLGWNPESLRIVIPAFDLDSHLKFTIQRAVRPRDMPRYLYPEGSGEAKKRLLFGGCLLDRRQVESQGLVLVEGSMDAIKLYELGFRNVVATLGNSISKQQRAIISRLRPKRLFLMFDHDVGGVEALLTAHRFIRKPTMLVCRYRKGVSDPADFKERREVERSLSRAVPISKWIVNVPEAR